MLGTLEAPLPRRSCPKHLLLPGLLLASTIAAAISSACEAAEDSTARVMLPPAVTETLAREGFRQITNVRLMGPSLVAHAISRNGLPARLVVDTDSGRILGFRLLDPEPITPRQR